MFTRPVWAEISRSNLMSNYHLLQEQAGPNVDLLTVVKANAYGHGVLECAPLLVAAGAQWIGVTCVEEGVSVRTVCPEVRVLVMSGVWQGEAEALLEHRLTPVVWEDFHFDLLEAAAAKLGLAAGATPIHLEIDTGMSRQGVRLMNDTTPLLRVIARLHPRSPLRVEGMMTHFSAPELLEDAATGEQIQCFWNTLTRLPAHGPHPRWVSAGNSATLLAQKDMEPLRRLALGVAARLLLRPGLSLYGYAPRFTPPHSEFGARLRPVLAWKTRITSLRDIEAGDGVGYDSTFRAVRPTRLALLPLGYADGVSRLLSNPGANGMGGEVLVRGRRAPIAGRVSMDQTIIDVTDISGVEIGDEVVLIGSQTGDQGEPAITAGDIADQTGTIPYEVLCGINQRVPRVLVD